MFRLSFLLLCALYAFSDASKVRKCSGAKSHLDLTDKVVLSPCPEKPPCKLLRNTDPEVSITFTPDTDIQELTNHVTANVLGVDVPYVGVDNQSVCEKIFTPAGAKASCPLKAGNTYVYKDSFHVDQNYQPITTDVHWALQQGGSDVICFEIRVKIV